VNHLYDRKEPIFSSGKLIASSMEQDKLHQFFAIPVRGKTYDNRTKTDITAAVLIYANTSYYEEFYVPLLSAITHVAITLAIGLSLFSYFFIRKTIAIPLEQLMSTVTEVEKGNYSPTIEVSGSPEFERFADLFRSMLQEIREKNNSLKEYSEMLEKKVEHRTAELQKSLEELKSAQKTIIQQEKMASIGKLAAGVAHEINNPTGFVIGNIVTLREYVDIFLIFYKETTELIGNIRELFDPNNKGEDGGILKAQINKIVGILDELRVNEDMTYIVEDIIPLLTEVDRGTERIKNIVQDLRDFSREDKNIFEKADINNGIENSIKIVWNKIKYKATIVKEMDPLPEVECNLLQLEQVFVNLLANAADSIDKKGEIRIRSRQIGSYVELIFSDNGSGMSPETSKRIFDPFYTTKEVGMGTGLGLSVSLGIIENHGGTINVDSNKGKGTDFIITLPINKDTIA
jgi:signal transduction histidine kinase